MSPKLKSWSPGLLNVFYEVSLNCEDTNHLLDTFIPVLYKLGTDPRMEGVWKKLAIIPNIKNLSGIDAQMLVVDEVHSILGTLHFNFRKDIPQNRKKQIVKINNQINKLINSIMSDVHSLMIAKDLNFLTKLIEFKIAQNDFIEYKNEYFSSDRAKLIRELYKCFNNIYGKSLSDCVLIFTNVILNLSNDNELGIEEITPYKPKEKSI